MEENYKTSNQEEVLRQCEKERDEYKEKFLRSVADFENFKRRSEQERSSLVDLGKRSILLDLLTIVADFERALDQNGSKEVDIKGFELIYKALEKTLGTHNVAEVVNHTTFDPQVHEALAHIESDNHTAGTIVEVIQKGYTYKEDLLRPAQVTVAK